MINTWPDMGKFDCMNKKKIKIAIIGSVGVPANYGGFETLVENLVIWHEKSGHNRQLSVWCSSKAYSEALESYCGAQLHYVPLSANGAQGIAYDIWCIISALRSGSDTLLLLGLSGGIALPFVRLLSRARVITNIDGIEWKRQKWRWGAKTVLRISERLAVNYSHVVIADNQAIADYVASAYGRPCHIIPYGGDHALEAEADVSKTQSLPQSYALALCRIEPENNVDMILQAYATLNRPLVFVGNWDRSDYGQKLKQHYKDHPHIVIHDPVYDRCQLRSIRQNAVLYLHGHSAGGTNPSLVEMMHFGIPVIAHGCSFNRHTTEGKARYFMSALELAGAVEALAPNDAAQIGRDMAEIAQRRYTWDQVGRLYFELADG
jgi:glycosyltransferase involved in cell wall biosynthesis